MREWAEHTRLKVEIEYEEQGLSRAKEAHGSRAHYTGERLLLCWFPASKVEPLFHPCLVKLLNESSEERVRRVWISRERRIYARWRTAMFNLRLNEESLSFFLSLLFLSSLSFLLEDGRYLIYADLSKRGDRWIKKLLDPETSILNFLAIRLNILLFSILLYSFSF